MFKRILVPTDGTAHEANLLRAAKLLAEREGAQLILLRVAPDRPADHVEHIEAREALAQAERTLRSGGADVRSIYSYGEPGERIAASAATEDVDLILISPRHRSLLGTLLQPSVTLSLLRRAPTPIMVWPERLSGDDLARALDTTSAPVIVPVDGSIDAEQAIPVAAMFARPRHRTIMLAHVLPPAPMPIVDPSYMVTSTTLEADEREDRRYLAELRRRVAEQTQLPVQSVTLVGPVAESIAHLAEGHPGCVIAMTTHGRGGAARLLLGSVAASLLKQTPAPLMILPPMPKETRQEPEAAHAITPRQQGPAEPMGPVPMF